jgi:hypothetical protein
MDHHSGTFTVEEALAVQREMRRCLGLGAEAFPLSAFIGMLSDEIERLRASGQSDAKIAALIERTIGRVFAESDIARYYASSDARRAGQLK